MNLIAKTLDFLQSRRYGTLFGILFAASAFSLITAYVAELLGYKPCLLCLYERIPFAIVLFLSCVGLRCGKISKFIAILCVVTLLANVMLSGYHSGVEHGVFKGPENCTTKDFTNIQSSVQLEKIITNTEEISCKNPSLSLFGLSLAEWNFIWNLCLFFFAMMTIMLRRLTAPK